VANLADTNWSVAKETKSEGDLSYKDQAMNYVELAQKTENRPYVAGGAGAIVCALYCILVICCCCCGGAAAKGA